MMGGFINDCAIDVVMVIDTSGSICDNKKENCQNWQDQRDAAAQFAEQLSQKNQESKVGVLTFSTNAQWHSKLTNNVNSIVSEIRSWDYVTIDGAWPRWTNLKAALDRAGKELLANPNPEHRQIVMVLTDGEPTAGGSAELGHEKAHVDAARIAADNVRANMQLAMVAIGGAADTSFMQSLVSQPVNENFFPVSTFQSLTTTFIEDILQEICKTAAPTPEPTPEPTPVPTYPRD